MARCESRRGDDGACGNPPPCGEGRRAAPGWGSMATDWICQNHAHGTSTPTRLAVARRPPRKGEVRRSGHPPVTIVIRHPFPPAASPYIAAMRPRDLLRPRPEGLYCPPGDFFIDPVRPVPRALVTHGHSDHARAGHGSVTGDAPDARHHGPALRRRLRGRHAGGRPRRNARRQRRRGHLPSRRPCARLRADLRRAWRNAHRRFGRLQAAAGRDLPAVRADPLRRVHHRGDVRPAGLPPSARYPGDRQARSGRPSSFPSARILSAPMRSARRSASSA